MTAHTISLPALPSRHQSPRLPPPSYANEPLASRLHRFVSSRGFYHNALLMFLADAANYTKPYLQARLIWMIERRATTGLALTFHQVFVGILVCAALFGLQCVNTVAINMYYKRAMALGMDVRGAVQAEVFDVCALHPDPTRHGNIVNLVANDAVRLDLCVPFLHYWWANPLQCVLVAVFLYRFVGWCGLIGVTVLIAFLPLQSVGAVLMGRERGKASGWTDKRLLALQQVLSGIRTVKLKGWEPVFASDAERMRAGEQGRLLRAQIIRGAISTMSVTLPLFAFLLTMFMYHVVAGNPVSQAVTVTVIAYFTLVRQPLSLIPMVVSSTSDARAALERISAFIDSCRSNGSGAVTSNPEIIVEMTNCMFKCNSFQVQGSLYISPGELVVITGPLGCGKSLLLMSILGELELVSGKCLISSLPKPYACQQPWIQNKSLRDNILFGDEFCEKLYAQVIGMCQLLPDLARLEDGDSTLIGDRGANLSGGQKSRVALARAVYAAMRRQSILILDDPLASVDAQVANRLIEECIDSLDVTRIVVSSHPLLLRRADKVIFMESGRIKDCGRPEDLLSSMHSCDEEPQAHERVHDLPLKSQTQPPSAPDLDTASHGAISRQVFSEYIGLAGGLLFVAAALFWSAMQQLTRTMSDIVANQWASSGGEHSSRWFMLVFSAYAVGHGASFFINNMCFVFGGRRAGRSIHQRGLRAVLAAPLTWTSAQNPGRLINRFSADQEIVDYVLPESLRSSAVTFANVLSTLILLVIHKWYNAVPIVLVIFVLMAIFNFYQHASRDLGRIAASSKGPLQGQFVEVVSGIVTIRAFQRVEGVRSRTQELINSASQAYYTQFCLQRWLELRVGMCGNLLILLAALSTLLITGPLALTTATMNKTLTVTGVLNWMVRRMADAEVQFISVERLVALAKVPMEALSMRKSLGPTFGGQSTGMKVEFVNVSARYEGTALKALQSVSFSVNPGERVGIVGRTGSGKSTLLLSLFRAVPMDSDSQILLDGHDIAAMDLHTLRHSIAIVPQEPFIFTQTVRRNLDPWQHHPDDVLWAALESVHLQELVSALPGALDYQFRSGDLSDGQRQLLAMARILLQRPRLLVMDEATASLDYDSETSILSLLSRQGPLSTCTILSIAHRIAVVEETCDRVVVLDDGRVVEEGSPEELFSRPGSYFASLSHASSML